jgi:hypothetical protein
MRFMWRFCQKSLNSKFIINRKIPWGEKLAVFVKFKNEILRPYGLRMTEKG